MVELFQLPTDSSQAARPSSGSPVTTAIQDQRTSPKSPSILTRASSFLDNIDEQSCTSFVTATAINHEPFTGANESVSTSTFPKRSPEHQDILSDSLRKRKGHKKSRNGCYNCKKRKIKCQENQPACHNCTRVKLACQYPNLQLIKTVQSPVLQRSNLQSTPTIFNASDMRLFHHFLVNAYPHLPLGNDSVWVREIATFAHTYDFLMEALLALAASHLAMISKWQLGCEALSHRVLAVNGLNKALSTSPSSAEEGDAILATCYALTFQTSYMGHSVEEFLVMLRGCALIVGQNWRARFGTAFRNFSMEEQNEIILPRLEALPLINQELVGEARESLDRMRELEMGEMEEASFASLRESIRLLGVSSLEAYVQFKEIHFLIGSLPNPAFQAFVDPSNTVAQILLAHFIALSMLMEPIRAQEWVGRDLGRPNREMGFTLDRIWNNVPEGMRSYLDWPMSATGSIPGVPSCIERLLEAEVA